MHAHSPALPSRHTHQHDAALAEEECQEDEDVQEEDEGVQEEDEGVQEEDEEVQEENEELDEEGGSDDVSASCKGQARGRGSCTVAVGVSNVQFGLYAFTACSGHLH